MPCHWPCFESLQDKTDKASLKEKYLKNLTMQVTALSKIHNRIDFRISSFVEQLKHSTTDELLFAFILLFKSVTTNVTLPLFLVCR